MRAATTADAPSRARPIKTTGILRGVAVAVAGNLGPGWSEADVARWLGYHGGRFVPSLAKSASSDDGDDGDNGDNGDDGDDGVTHLLCTPEEYAQPKKLQCANLQRALARGHRGPRAVHVVLRDWLEDSLHGRRRRRERPYLLRHVCRARQQEPGAVQQRLAAQRAQGQRQGETFVDTTLYRVYRDRTGFAYKATIRRDHEPAGIFGERYVLYLFESMARPHLYWFAARHYKSRTHTQARVFRPSGTCQLFETEYAHFCAFFLKKTGVAWDARLVGEAPARKPAAQAADLPGFFCYDKPARGTPLGIIEDEKNRPQEGEDERASKGGQADDQDEDMMGKRDDAV